jgi:hypothetical protein
VEILFVGFVHDLVFCPRGDKGKVALFYDVSLGLFVFFFLLVVVFGVGEEVFFGAGKEDTSSGDGVDDGFFWGVLGWCIGGVVVAWLGDKS